jgi:hypothetical protein
MLVFSVPANIAGNCFTKVKNGTLAGRPLIF